MVIAAYVRTNINIAGLLGPPRGNLFPPYGQPWTNVQVEYLCLYFGNYFSLSFLYIIYIYFSHNLLFFFKFNFSRQLKNILVNFNLKYFLYISVIHFGLYRYCV